MISQIDISKNTFRCRMVLYGFANQLFFVFLDLGITLSMHTNLHHNFHTSLHTKWVCGLRANRDYSLNSDSSF